MQPLSAAPPTVYSATQKWLHWLVALIIACMELHKSSGMVVFTLALVRIAIRARRGGAAGAEYPRLAACRGTCLSLCPLCSDRGGPARRVGRNLRKRGCLSALVQDRFLEPRR